MHTEKILLTIITEDVLEKEITQHLRKLGAHGYTVFDARGKGGQEFKAGDRVEVANIQVQVICSELLADEVEKAFQHSYFADFAMVIYRSAVQVIRSQKF